MARQTREPNWPEALNFCLALKNVRTDIMGDWYRDPWGWPELEWAVENSQSSLKNRFNGTGVWRCYPMDVPKENFHIRPALILDPIDRFCYQAIVDRLSPDLIGHLSDQVYGWRLPHGSTEPGHSAYNKYNWRNYLRKLASLSTQYRCALKTDIVSYFASISIAKLTESIQAKTSTGKIPNRLINLLENWGNISRRSGIPQRCSASSVLANMYLKPIDDILNQQVSCRWMDDIWVFGDKPGDLRKIQIELQQCLTDLGLNINSAKTDVLEEENLIKSIQNMEHSYIDLDLENDSPDKGSLLDLIDKILQNPEQAYRSDIRFVTTRMRYHNYYKPVYRFVEKAKRMPHGADHLARLFRDSNVYNDLSEWYIHYSKSNWATIEWPVAQLGTMFPSDNSISSMVQYFGERLNSHSNISLPLSSLIASRLAKWDSNVARTTIREALVSEEHPLKRRSLAFAALVAGEEQHVVRRALQEFDENKIILDMLDQTNWRPPDLDKDYQ